MIIYEDEELEKAFLCGELPVASMISVSRRADAPLSVTSMKCARHTAEEYIHRFSASPFSEEAKEFISARAEKFFADHGYEYEESARDTLLEFYPEKPVPRSVLPDDARLILCEGEELSAYENLLECDPGEGLCAAVICGNSLVCAAGINDYSDSDETELYVECAEDYRRRGFAKCALLALCERLNGESVVYKTYSSNLPSVNLARSAGFVLGGEELFAVGYLPFDEVFEDTL